MKRLVLITLALLIAACAESTSPTGRRALRDCDSRDPGQCVDFPHVDSISPSVQPAGHLGPFFVCIYGTNLAGGRVFYGTTEVAADSPGCGVFVFTVPSSDVGTFPVYVTTPTGTSNAAYFTRE